MLYCGISVMKEFSDFVICYGQSDEFSFVLKKSSNLYGRNRDLIISSVVSCFSSYFVLGWNNFFQNTKLQYEPSFDARAVIYPTEDIVIDYLSWRQADSHINSLYNYSLCVLMRTGLDGPEATQVLSGTLSAQKNEILMKHGINFLDLPESHRRGTTLIRTSANDIIQTTEDMIKNDFWIKYKKYLD